MRRFVLFAFLALACSVAVADEDMDELLRELSKDVPTAQVKHERETTVISEPKATAEHVARGWATPIAFAFDEFGYTFPGGPAPDVYGLRIGLLSNHHGPKAVDHGSNVYGVDFGFFPYTLCDNVYGAQVSMCFSACEGGACVQVAPIGNDAGDGFYGAQVGIVNLLNMSSNAERSGGVQIGLVNVAGRNAAALQIGVLNLGGWCLPFVNFTRDGGCSFHQTLQSTLYPLPTDL